MLVAGHLAALLRLSNCVNACHCVPPCDRPGFGPPGALSARVGAGKVSADSALPAEWRV
jgi:hypothetical protein